MEGTLYKIEKGWVVRYWDNDLHIKGSPKNVRQIVIELEVHPFSLSNPDLSTYWVEGRIVNFNQSILPNGKSYVLIWPDKETWDDIFKNICDQDLTNFNDIWNWLKENYEPPKKIK